MLIVVIFDKQSLVCCLTLHTACLVLTFGCISISRSGGGKSVRTTDDLVRVIFDKVGIN